MKMGGLDVMFQALLKYANKVVWIFLLVIVLAECSKENHSLPLYDEIMEPDEYGNIESTPNEDDLNDIFENNLPESSDEHGLHKSLGVVFFNGFNSDIFRSIQSDEFNALGNRINNGLAVYNHHEDHYYVVDIHELTTMPQTEHNLPYVYVMADGFVTKLFSHYIKTNLQLLGDEIYYLSSYFAFTPQNKSEVASFSDSGHTIYTSAGFGFDEIFESFDIVEDYIYFQLEDSDEIRRVVKSGMNFSQALRERSEIVATSSGFNFQISDTQLFYINDNTLYRYKDGVHERVLLTNASKFLIDEFFIFIDDENRLYILLDDLFVNIAKEVITFNYFNDVIYFSTNEGLFSFDTNLSLITKLIDTAQGIPIDKININHERLMLRRDFIYVANLDGSGATALHLLSSDVNETSYVYSSIRFPFSIRFPIDGFSTFADGASMSHRQFGLLDNGYGDTRIIMAWDEQLWWGESIIEHSERRYHTTDKGVEGFFIECIDDDIYSIIFAIPSTQIFPAFPAQGTNGYYFISAEGPLFRRDEINDVVKMMVETITPHITSY